MHLSAYRYLTNGLQKDRKISVNKSLTKLIEIVRPEDGVITMEHWIDVITTVDSAWEVFTEISPFRSLGSAPPVLKSTKSFLVKDSKVDRDYTH